jgi:hypothetical protein
VIPQSCQVWVYIVPIESDSGSRTLGYILREILGVWMGQAQSSDGGRDSGAVVTHNPVGAAGSMAVLDSQGRTADGTIVRSNPAAGVAVGRAPSHDVEVNLEMQDQRVPHPGSASAASAAAAAPDAAVRRQRVTAMRAATAVPDTPSLAHTHTPFASALAASAVGGGTGGAPPRALTLSGTLGGCAEQLELDRCDANLVAAMFRQSAADAVRARMPLCTALVVECGMPPVNFFGAGDCRA